MAEAAAALIFGLKLRYADGEWALDGGCGDHGPRGIDEDEGAAAPAVGAKGDKGAGGEEGEAAVGGPKRSSAARRPAADSSALCEAVLVLLGAAPPPTAPLRSHDDEGEGEREAIRLPPQQQRGGPPNVPNSRSGFLASRKR